MLRGIEGRDRNLARLRGKTLALAAKEKGAPRPTAAEGEYPETAARCWFCNGRYRKSGPLRSTVEHLVPLSGGGTDRPANIVRAHGLCNELAGGISFEEKLILRDILFSAGAPVTRASRRAALAELLRRKREMELTSAAALSLPPKGDDR